MDRAVAADLDTWIEEPARRPLILRGARQVGKTWLVRDLARRHGRDLVEVNFERDPRLARPFVEGEPRSILGELQIALERDFDLERVLLFLDEIQAAPRTLARLRWFAEELPDLPVVAAGSLLDFVLAEHDFSMPVGRIGYGYLGPMRFDEYLAAHDQRRLLEHLRAWNPGAPMSSLVHEKATEWFDRYVMVGGMPAVVALDVAGREPRACRALQRDLVVAYRDDFAKYAGRLEVEIIDATLSSIANQIGQKFVYSRVQEGVRHTLAKQALELLAKARLCHVVAHSAANGLPLAGEINPRLRKVVLVDVGLLHAILGTPARDAFPSWTSLSARVRGRLAEQVVAQQLATMGAPWEEPRLFYWQRTGGRPGEIDYLLQVGLHVVPIELKSGAAGAMKSLHQFVHDKGLDLAVRLDRNPPSFQVLDLSTTLGDHVRYRLLSLPHYLSWRVPVLVERSYDAS